MKIVVSVALLAFLAAGTAFGQAPDISRATLEVNCTRIVDGDTLELRGGETVRLLGIDTPETGEPYANEAKWLLYEWVAHKPLRLELDEEDRDVYNRLLAHIYVETEEEGWVLVNAELVRAGLANLLFIPPNNRYRDHFEQALEEAMLQRRGLWGAVEGSLSVVELEGDLVTCITEMVTVEFTVGEIVEKTKHVVLYAAEGTTGFYLKITWEMLPELGIQDVSTLLGTCMIATGVVDCERVGLGPSITLEYPQQLQWPCPVSAESEDG